MSEKRKVTEDESPDKEGRCYLLICLFLRNPPSFLDISFIFMQFLHSYRIFFQSKLKSLFFG